MSGRIVLDRLGEREMAALLVGGELEDFLIDPASGTDFAQGAVFRAIVDRALKVRGGAIARLPSGRKAFVKGAGECAAGASILVQISSYAESGKAMPATLNVRFKRRYAVAVLERPGINLSRSIQSPDRRVYLASLAERLCRDAPHNVGVILRSECADACDREIASDVRTVLGNAEKALAGASGKSPELLLPGPRAGEIAQRDWKGAALADSDGAGFEESGIWDMLHDVRGERFEIQRGATMYVQETRALVAVDVNTGSDTSPGSSLKANLAAARELPRLLRLKGLGGQIVIDFAPSPKNSRDSIVDALRNSLSNDPVDTSLAGWTPLGNFELQRKRSRYPLSEAWPE